MTSTKILYHVKLNIRQLQWLSINIRRIKDKLVNCLKKEFSSHQEHMTILNICVSNNRVSKKKIRQRLPKQKAYIYICAQLEKISNLLKIGKKLVRLYNT